MTSVASGLSPLQPVVHVRPAVAQRRPQHRRMAARVEHVAARVVERQAQAEGQALAHFGDALLHLLRREQVQPAELVVGPEIAPGRASGRFFQRGRCWRSSFIVVSVRGDLALRPAAAAEVGLVQHVTCLRFPPACPRRRCGRFRPGSSNRRAASAFSTSCSTSRIAMPSRHSSAATSRMRSMTIGASPPEGSSRISRRGSPITPWRDREDLLLPAGQSRKPGLLRLSFSSGKQRRRPCPASPRSPLRRFGRRCRSAGCLPPSACWNTRWPSSTCTTPARHDLARRRARQVAAVELRRRRLSWGSGRRWHAGKVLLPAPLRPSSTTNSPARTSSETPCTTSALP